MSSNALQCCYFCREESVSGKQRLQSEILEGLLADEDDTHESRPSSSGAVSDDEQTDGSRPVSRSNSISEDPHHYYQWERKYICLMACYPLISFSTANDKDFLLNVRDISIKLLTHPRVRVQLAAGNFTTLPVSNVLTAKPKNLHNMI